MKTWHGFSTNKLSTSVHQLMFFCLFQASLPLLSNWSSTRNAILSAPPQGARPLRRVGRRTPDAPGVGSGAAGRGLRRSGADASTSRVEQIPDTPWDWYIYRSVGVVLGVNGAAYMAVPWSVWDTCCMNWTFLPISADSTERTMNPAASAFKPSTGVGQDLSKLQGETASWPFLCFFFWSRGFQKEALYI